MQTDWIARWLLICAVAMVDAFWLWADGMGLDIGTLGPRLKIASPFLAGAAIAVLLSMWMSRLPRLLGASADFFYSVAQFLLLLPTTAALTYFAATIDAPLVDGALLHADQLIGFDWQVLDTAVTAHPSLAMLLRLVYVSVFAQCLIVMLVGSFSRPGERNSEFFWLFSISLILCTVISGLLPALGYEGAIGPAHIEALKSVRSGQWTTLNYEKIDGIITFPSFHAAMAVVFVYPVRRVRFALGLMAGLNTLMLLSTPTVGGHYLVDIIAGVGIAFVAIWMTRAIRHATFAPRYYPRALHPYSVRAARRSDS